jgi:hypothetical protein
MVITKIRSICSTMTTIHSKVVSKKMLVYAGIAVAVILTGILVVYPAIYSVSAVQSSTNTTAPVSGYGQLPKITGSINVVQTTKNIIRDNLKLSFSQAADIAGKQISNSTTVGGHLGIVQGYLVYTFFAVNPTNHTGYVTIVDAGNGKVLYTSQAQQTAASFGTQGRMFGHEGIHGFGEGFRHGPYGHPKAEGFHGWAGTIWH